MDNHKTFRNDKFWQQVPMWTNIDRDTFANHKWQVKNTVKNLKQVKEVIEPLTDARFIQDIEEALKIVPMNIKINPYILSLINWDDPYNDPLRKQFLPIKSQLIPDHPLCIPDSLHEDEDAPVPQLTHRYPDKVLFLTVPTCEVLCAYCTRSRVVGGSTNSYEKKSISTVSSVWDPAFDYIEKHEAIEDVVISGGDAFVLPPKKIRQLGGRLLDIPHIRRIRYATKGLAINPVKILSDPDWYEAILEMVQYGRKLGKHVCIHTHFSHPNEITDFTQEAALKLFQDGITVRNQAVLQKGVNDDPEVMILLNKKLSYLNIHPYYVYQHDQIPGCENLRTSLKEAVELEKQVRGTTAGFNTPTFVCDLPGGGGKRHIASYEYYDQENGISVWKAPNVKPNEIFLYFDPLHSLSPEAQARWQNEATRNQMIEEAKAKI